MFLLLYYSTRIYQPGLFAVSMTAIVVTILMPKIVAHRGASAQAKENTLEAFKLAIELRVDYIELDVWKTSDGVLVINHDPSQGDIIIADTTYKELLNNPDCKHIPTLSQVLALASGNTKLYVEIKDVGYEKDVIDMLLSNCDINDFAIISFIDDVILNVKEHAPAIYTGMLLKKDGSARKKTRIKDMFPMRRMSRCKADFLAPQFSINLYVVILQAYIYNVPLYMWTINNPLRYQLVSKLPNVETIASDLPSFMAPDLLKGLSIRKHLKARLRNTVQ
jgi:glycerophosphoryl diester phosphodiesterase